MIANSPSNKAHSVPLLERLQHEANARRIGSTASKLHVVTGSGLPHSKVDGIPALVLCSNDYLGLANDTNVKAAATEVLNEQGNGLAAGRTIAGTTNLHISLEEELATLSRQESALLLPSAFTANVGLLTTILATGDYVFSDQLNHASIIDGCRYSGASVRVYPHRDMTALRQLLTEVPAGAAKLIVTDGIFSMEGDIAPLPELVELKNQFGAALMVDDAHGVGVLGRTGAGTVEHFDLFGEVDIQVGTLGKALGGATGGYVAGSAALVDNLVHRCRNFIFTNPITASAAAGSLSAIRALRERPELRERLWRNARLLRTGLEGNGFRIVAGETPIIPVLLGEDKLATSFSARLLNRGVFVQAFAHPVVPKGEARLRCIASAAHSTADIETAIGAFTAVGRDLGVVR